MNTRTWTPAIVQPSSLKHAPESVAAKTQQLLAGRGWCAWMCSALGNAVIIIVRDDTVTGYPAGLPVFAVAELEEIKEVDISMVRLIYEAKRLERQAAEPVRLI